MSRTRVPIPPHAQVLFAIQVRVFFDNSHMFHLVERREHSRSSIQTMIADLSVRALNRTPLREVHPVANGQQLPEARRIFVRFDLSRV